MPDPEIFSVAPSVRPAAEIETKARLPGRASAGATLQITDRLSSGATTVNVWFVNNLHRSRVLLTRTSNRSIVMLPFAMLLCATMSKAQQPGRSNLVPIPASVRRIGSGSLRIDSSANCVSVSPPAT